jgi:hypothetical protein
MFVSGLNAPKPTTASHPRPDTPTIKHPKPIFMGCGCRPHAMTVRFPEREGSRHERLAELRQLLRQRRAETSDEGVRR